LNQIQVVHFDLRYDPSITDLVIDRKLKEGRGPTTYGIEVAKSLNFSDSYIRGAMAYRAEAMEINNEILPTNKSRYNGKIYRDVCILCGDNKDLHSHHLIPQKEADNQGFIGHIPKNIAGNLVTLCSNCHHHIHSEGSQVTSLNTVSGVVLKLNH